MNHKFKTPRTVAHQTVPIITASEYLDNIKQLSITIRDLELQLEQLESNINSVCKPLSSTESQHVDLGNNSENKITDYIDSCQKTKKQIKQHQIELCGLMNILNNLSYKNRIMLTAHYFYRIPLIEMTRTCDKSYSTIKNLHRDAVCELDVVLKSERMEMR